jgi:hypothetical protein
MGTLSFTETVVAVAEPTKGPTNRMGEYLNMCGRVYSGLLRLVELSR